ncbi:hypothetical protein BCR42DRAFT_417890 [Absidia repens]|uniref:Uncharacterized protein n=1 Tax=Absidia repens TaxID=90262 RepID=A0A1X2ICK6_9FUNG|nr:hypothetical protein BCR42DRAFT_417890 [Absidia repens]
MTHHHCDPIPTKAVPLADHCPPMKNHFCREIDPSPFSVLPITCLAHHPSVVFPYPLIRLYCCCLWSWVPYQQGGPLGRVHLVGNGDRYSCEKSSPILAVIAKFEKLPHC